MNNCNINEHKSPTSIPTFSSNNNGLFLSLSLSPGRSTSIVSSAFRLAQMKESHQQLIEQKHSLLNEHFSSADQQRRTDQLISIDQKHHQLLHDHSQQLSHQLFLVQSQLKTFTDQQEHLQTQQQISSKQRQHQQQHIDHLDQQLLKQQEFIDHQDFRKQTLERHINQINNQHQTTMTDNDSQASDLHRRIEQLKKDLLDKTNHFNQIQAQIKLLHNDLRSSRDQLDHLNQHKTLLQEDLLQLDLALHFNDKQINTFINHKQVNTNTQLSLSQDDHRQRQSCV